jgi:LuxR family maltose regulon positive regulatory protein
MVAVLAALIYAWMGRPVEAERWADAVDRWQDAARSDDPSTEAWAALARALLCRRGVSRMLADADEAARGFTAQGIVTSGPVLLQGIARVLSGDLDGGDELLKDAVSLGEKTGAHEIVAQALSERSMVAMARGEWSLAELMAGQARTALSQAGIEESYVMPLVCAAQARVASHQGDVAAARHEVVRAQRLRPLLSHATPHVAVQARIELTRVHLALADVAGARTLIREIDELLKRRPDLGTLVGEARALRTQLSAERAPAVPGASSLTGAELRVLPMLATHLSFPEIGADLFLSPHTVKSQAMSIYRKLGASSRSQAVARSRELGLLEGLRPVFHSCWWPGRAIRCGALARTGIVGSALAGKIRPGGRGTCRRYVVSCQSYDAQPDRPTLGGRKGEAPS